MGEDPASRGTPSGHFGAPTLRPARWTVRRFSSLDSTNRWLLDEARAGAPAGLVVVADHQEAGHGRRGRTWEAPEGSSLLMSLLLRPSLAPDRLHVVTMRVALALVDALGTTAGMSADLKWPNDVVVGERKVAGLLTEADISGGSVRAVVVGVGCNLAQSAFKGELAEIATSVALETGRAPERDVVLDGVLEHLGARLEASPTSIRADYRERLSTLGRDVRVELDDRVIAGRARDIDDVGRLLVEPRPGEIIAVSVGDVVHLRPG